ncbi:MAG: hypothetical protein ACLPX9_01720 [Rhodomicrobium sp.]
MKIGGVHYRTIQRDSGGTAVCIAGQTKLPSICLGGRALPRGEA